MPAVAAQTTTLHLQTVLGQIGLQLNKYDGAEANGSALALRGTADNVLDIIDIVQGDANLNMALGGNGTPGHAGGFAEMPGGLKGTVTKFQWTNPHAYLEIDVKDSKGAVKHYTLEGTSINMMQRIGWRSNMLKFGDSITVVMAPAASGDPVGLLLEVTLANGEVKPLGVPASDTFKRTPEKEQKP